MKTFDINDFEKFEELYNDYEHIIIKIGANWCAPCKRIATPMKNYIDSINTDKIVMLQINYDDYKFEERYNDYFVVQKIPYFVFLSSKISKLSVQSSDFAYVSGEITRIIQEIDINNEIIFRDEKVEYIQEEEKYEKQEVIKEVIKETIQEITFTDDF